MPCFAIMFSIYGYHSRFYDTRIQNFSEFLYQAFRGNPFNLTDVLGQTCSERCRLRR